jgi:hypothetical protein
MRKLLLTLFLSAAFISVLGQDAEETSSPDNSLQGHYLGLQANQLLRQILNFGGSSSAINNPFLLTYSTNNASGAGGNFSLGYNYTQTNDGDAITRREVTNSDFNFRAGLEKKSRLGKRLILAAGGDIVYQSLKVKTKVTDNFSGNFSTVNKTSGFGFGPRLSIYFQITDNFLVATEANYYLKFLNQTFDVNPGDKEEEDVKQLQLNVPAAIFLVLKL